MSPANAVYSADELTYQLKNANAKALFTCVPSLSTALKAAEAAGLPRRRVYIIDLPPQLPGSGKAPAEFKTLEQFIEDGSSLRSLDALKWVRGQGAKQTAFLCYSSGTSGLPVRIPSLIPVNMQMY